MGKHVAALVLVASILIGGVLMPDAPDGGKYQLQGSKDTLADLGELAARIDARDTWDRRGQVIWYDRFEGGLAPWSVIGSGTGYGVTVDASKAEWAGYSALLTAGSNAAKYAGIYRFFAPPEVNKWGAELGVAFTTEYDYFTLNIQRFDGVNRHWAILAINNTEDAIKILLDDSTYLKVSDLPNSLSTDILFHQIKLVIDIDTGRYVRAMFDDIELDLSDYSYQQVLSGGIHCQKIMAYFHGRSGNNDTANIGHMIVTVGEP